MGTREIFDGKGLKRALTRIAHEILEKNGGSRDLAIVGLQTRGVFLAQRIAKKIEKIEGEEIPQGILDITLYRDDVAAGNVCHEVKKTDISFPIDNKKVVLIDDVLFTGRSIRAAIDALIDFGRPQCIQLGILIDRGHRELPIRPDYIGKNIPTARNERVKVMLAEEDGEDRVLVEWKGGET